MRPFTTAPAWRSVGYPGAPATPAYQPMRFSSRETRVRRARGVIAAVIFLALVGGGWLAETRGVLVKLREGALAALQTKSPADPSKMSKTSKTTTAGRLVYELPDGESCTYVPFDNIAEWMGEPTTTMCEEVARKLRRTRRTEFSWGGR